MSFQLIDEPPDDWAEFLREALGVISTTIRRERERLLARVAAADDATLAAGTDDDWGLGQVALHLLAVERGISWIALRLARGEPPGPTGQPRPAAGSATRDGLASLAAKAEERLSKLVAEFPPDPNMTATARQPYYGELNCVSWLLAVPLHYAAHLAALERGTKSAL